MDKTTGLYPSLTVDAAGNGVVPHAGAVLLMDTAATVGLDRGPVGGAGAVVSSDRGT